jgi:hypothetical protein
MKRWERQGYQTTLLIESGRTRQKALSGSLRLRCSPDPALSANGGNSHWQPGDHPRTKPEPLDRAPRPHARGQNTPTRDGTAPQDFRLPADVFHRAGRGRGATPERRLRPRRYIAWRRDRRALGELECPNAANSPDALMGRRVPVLMFVPLTLVHVVSQSRTASGYAGCTGIRWI